MIQSFILNPKKLFLLDALGGSISVILLGVVLVKLERVFGIPESTLYFLAAIPALFILYDLFCLSKSKNNLGPFLKLIALMNIMYCCLSIGLAIYHLKTITFFGYLYILIEVIITFTLAVFEFKVANKLAKR
tara:strand:+ start:49 stop:444 length:396 start_codon:yes stop_codon:yes gene_type:complete